MTLLHFIHSFIYIPSPIARQYNFISTLFYLQKACIESSCFEVCDTGETQTTQEQIITLSICLIIIIFNFIFNIFILYSSFNVFFSVLSFYFRSSQVKSFIIIYTNNDCTYTQECTMFFTIFLF